MILKIVTQTQKKHPISVRKLNLDASHHVGPTGLEPVTP